MFLRHIGKCRQNPDLDCGVSLCPDRHRQEAPPSGSVALHFATDSVGLPPIQQAFSDVALQSEGLQTDNQLNLFEF